ncbi:hypothetical protein AB1M95_07120 [Sulfitobacter sp. LCG007]
MSVDAPDDDPKGLLREAFRIDGIEAPECRSIFLDWALSLPSGVEPRAALERMLSRIGDELSDHPMYKVMQDGLRGISAPRRRGGWRARQRN